VTAIRVIERSSARRERRASSRAEIVRALGGVGARDVWIVRSARGLRALLRAIGEAEPGVRRARLVSYAAAEPSTAHVLSAAFERALMPCEAMVGLSDLREILAAEHPEDLAVAAAWEPLSDSVAVWRGDLSVLLLGRDTLPDDPARPGTLAVVDCGQTLRVGTFEISLDAVLFESDAAYRRRARRRMIREERGLGPSIRRLRLLRGVRRDDFPGLDEKTVARIERGEVTRPRRATLAVIAKRLDVGADELEDF
jgi:hypothetical protein